MVTSKNAWNNQGIFAETLHLYNQSFLKPGCLAQPPFSRQKNQLSPPFLRVRLGCRIG